MKNKIKSNIRVKVLASSLFVFLLLISSCEKDFLEEAPQDKISNAQFWKSGSDLRLYANNFYNYFPAYSGYHTIGPFGQDADEGSDNMIRVAHNRRLNAEVVLNSTSNLWNRNSWRDIRNINYFLDNYYKSTEDFNVIKKYVGEAYFFKAMRYFNKVKLFGDVPWYTKGLKPGDKGLYAPRTPRNVVIDSIISNLDKAIAHLPTKSKAEKFRVNKEIALLLQARIALYEGTWEKYHKGTEFGVNGSDGRRFLEKAVLATKKIMNSGAYGLDNIGTEMGYWKLFNQTDYSSSKEIMLWRKWDIGNGLFSRWNRYTTAGSGRGVTKSLVDDYLCVDGKPTDKNVLYKGDDNLISLVKNRDPRLAQTIQVNDGKHFVTDPGKPFTIPAFNTVVEELCPTGYQLYKGHNTSASQQTDNGGNVGVIYFRYAEVLLIFAEAKAELGTLTQGDVDKSINLLRDRVKMSHLNISSITNDPKWIFSNLSPIINEVRRERRVELAAEGYRHDDVMRWAAADKLIAGWKPRGAKRAQWSGKINKKSYPIDSNGYIEPYQKSGPVSNGYKFKVGRDYLLPIPLNEITLNPNLKQNPGW